MTTVALTMSVGYTVFDDVPDVHPNVDAIEHVQGAGIVKGYPDGTYQPDRNINRAEFVKIIVEALYPGQASGGGCFPDVSNEWFAPYVCFAKARGTIVGYPDGTFKPGNNLNFSESAAIITKAFDLPQSGNSTWYEPFVNGLASRNVIPVTIDSFAKNITRGEMAEMIYRLDANISNKLSLNYESILNNNFSVQQFTVPESETYMMAQHSIVSQQGIKIDGNLTFMRSENTEAEANEVFELIAETGDLEINGAIRIAGASEEFAFVPSEDGRSLVAMLGIPLALTQQPGTGIGGKITPIFGQRSIKLTALSGNIIIGNTARLETFNGRAGRDTIVGNLNNAREIGAEDGEDGGDIILSAPTGQIRIIVPHKDVAGLPLFDFGDGGKGGNVLVNFDSFADESAFDGGYTARAGDGGRSGQFIPKAGAFPPVVYYMRMPNTLVVDGPIDPKSGVLIERVVVLGGIGGDGGEVTGDINKEHDFTNLPLIEFFGGRGGDGIRSGGNGGDGIYNNVNQLAMTADGDNAPTAKAGGGNGGDVVFSYLPVNLAKGGDGGLCFVKGNGGFDGANETDADRPSNGQNGGGASCFMGNGGSILKDKVVPVAFTSTPFIISSYKAAP